MNDDIVDRLRDRACPAHLPWTGDNEREDHGHTDCWLHHQAADQIDRYETRSEHYLERIIELQEEAQRAAAPAGYINIQIPIGLVEQIIVEQIIETERILFALEHIRTVITKAYDGNDR